MKLFRQFWDSLDKIDFRSLDADKPKMSEKPSKFSNSAIKKLIEELKNKWRYDFSKFTIGSLEGKSTEIKCKCPKGHDIKMEARTLFAEGLPVVSGFRRCGVCEIAYSELNIEKALV